MKKILLSLIFLASLFVFIGCDIAGPTGDILVNTWKIQSETFSTSSSTNTRNYPLDFFSSAFDPDGDGTDETLIVDKYLKISDTSFRYYQKVDLTDGGSDVATLKARGYKDSFTYNPSQDQTYTLNGNIATTEDSSGNISIYTYSISPYSISGFTLTLIKTDDHGTPSDTADDVAITIVLKLSSDSDVADAESRGI